MRRVNGWGLGVLGALLLSVAAVAQTGGAGDGRIGPDRQLTGNGRHLTPFGHLVGVGNFPVGGAVTPDGRFYWTLSGGRGPNDIRIVDVRSERVIQTITLPGLSGGVAIDPRTQTAYVSGVVGSPHKAQALPPDTPGIAGDVVHVLHFDASSGHASYVKAIPVPPPSSAPVPQSFPPTNSTKIAWPDHLALSPDGHTLLVPLNLAGAVAIVSVPGGGVTYVPTGRFPYAAAITPDGNIGLVSNEGPGTVTLIDVRGGRGIRDIQVGPPLSHPEGIAIDPSGTHAYVALANTDQVAVIDLHARRVEASLDVGRPAGLGTSPVALAVTPDGERLIVAEASADELSVFALHSTPDHPAFTRIGRIPTAAYPDDVQVLAPGLDPCIKRAAAKRHHRRAKHRAAKAPASCAKLLYIAGKGLGTGANTNGPVPTSPNDSDDAINAFQYLPLINFGSASIGDLPTDAQLAHETVSADRQIVPSNAQRPPADTPIRPDGPIKHVFYIVRENRTYDQILGDLGRGDGDPALTLFGQKVTPNAHALANRFPLLDHFYANSEASIDGHFWTAAGAVSDYVHKSWFQNYRDGSAKTGRPYDYTYAITWPGSGFLFDQAQRQGISYFNYGEGIGDTTPFPDVDRTPAQLSLITQNLLHEDLGTNGCYPNDASIGKDAVTGLPVFDSTPPTGAPITAQSRFDCFSLRFTAQQLTSSVPTFNYLVLSNDHTRVLSPGAYTPSAMVADNDRGLGQMIDAISHSSVWADSAIFVTEDDSQDGADHVDAHRTVGFVISPYAKRGAVVSRRYDMLSMIRTMELIMGMHPLGLGDALATPMYDAFQATPDNSEPFAALPAGIDLLATNPTPASAAARAALRFRGLDQITQRSEDRLLWRSVHGAAMPPPPPGPNAVVEPTAGRAHPDG